MLALAAGVSGAATSEGPRLAVTRWPAGRAPFELLSTDAVGASQQEIVRGYAKSLPAPVPFGGPSWSPDGGTLAFTGVVGLPRKGVPLPRLKVFLVSADGTGLRAAPGASGGDGPVFSPDGRSLAFTRLRIRTRRNGGGHEGLAYESASVWLADLATGAVRRLTPWGNGVINEASSFSPDGKLLAISRRNDERLEALTLSLEGAGLTVLTRNGFSPRYSPDGSTIMFLRGPRRTFKQRTREGKKVVERTVTTTVADIYAMNADGTGLRRLTNTPRLSESPVSWDPSGQRIAYTTDPPAASAPFGNTIMESNSDGTCATPVLTDFEFAYIGPAWQPGAGRAAGRISC